MKHRCNHTEWESLKLLGEKSDAMTLLTTTKPARIGLGPNPSFRYDTPGNNSLSMARSFERTNKPWCTIVTLKLCYPS